MLIFAFFSYLVITIPIIALVYEKSHFFVVRLKEVLIDQEPKHFYTATLNTINTFRELNGDGRGTPSEIRERILDSISMVAFIIKNLCKVWKSPKSDRYQKTCDLSIACDLRSILDKMLNWKLNKRANEIYLIEVQDTFNNHFDYLDVFMVANKIDQAIKSTFRTYQDQGDVFQKLQIDPSDSDLRKEIKITFNLLLDLSEAYYDCRQHFPHLEDFKMDISFVKEVGTTREGKKLVRLKNQPEWKFAESLKRYLNLLYLYLCLNHHQMIFINSIVALLTAFWWFHIGIVLLYCVFPTVPFGIALSLEALQHYAYRKLFGCACRIKKKLSILKVLAQARTHHMPKIPKFDNMRMYKRRKRKVDSNK